MIELKQHTGRHYVLHGNETPCAGTVAKEANTTDYSLDKESIRRAEKALLKSITGIGERNILMLNQVHGDTILQVDKAPDEDRRVLGEGDGMITDVPGICLVVRTADCVPVIAFDARRKVLGAVHSGWRGCRLAIARKLIDTMKDRYVSRPGDIRVFILPSIGPQSYTVNEDVAAFFPDAVSRSNGRIHLDLWKSISASLGDTGIPAENIFTSGICSLEHSARFFSHRNGDTGRNLNYAYIPR